MTKNEGKTRNKRKIFYLERIKRGELGGREQKGKKRKVVGEILSYMEMMKK